MCLPADAHTHTYTWQNKRKCYMHRAAWDFNLISDDENSPRTKVPEWTGCSWQKRRSTCATIECRQSLCKAIDESKMWRVYANESNTWVTHRRRKCFVPTRCIEWLRLACFFFFFFFSISLFKWIDRCRPSAALTNLKIDMVHSLNLRNYTSKCGHTAHCKRIDGRECEYRTKWCLFHVEMALAVLTLLPLSLLFLCLLNAQMTNQTFSFLFVLFL